MPECTEAERRYLDALEADVCAAVFGDVPKSEEKEELPPIEEQQPPPPPTKLFLWLSACEVPTAWSHGLGVIAHRRATAADLEKLGFVRRGEAK